MKIFSVLSMILGVVLTFLGTLPFIFKYPHTDSPNSGPANIWELILMISYDGRGWYLIIGIGLLILTVSLIFKQRNLKF
ncbi:hypothetical protein ACFSO7_12400 [Bacillus sp. CGMCC 1.16607]|uniref:hypothetical protein n=1 Tax=Bacillus sp. CGMCC 1.16607 TaxID=3351842 RepID=UPI003630BC38